MKQKSCFITGILGFVGSNLAHKLLSEGFKVAGCDDLSFGSNQNLIDLNIYHQCDVIIDDFANLNLSNYDVVIHCATSNIIFAQNNKQETIYNNYTKLKNSLLNNKLNTRIIYISTASVYGSASIIPTPESAHIKLTNAYAESKWLGELLFQNQTILRLSNVYGTNQRASNPYSGVIGKFINASLNNSKLEVIGDGLQTRDFTHISDVCNAIFNAISLNAYGTFNIASNTQTSILQLIHILKIPSSQISYIQKRPIDNIQNRCLNIDKAKKYLNYYPLIDIQTGLNLTIQFQKNKI